MSKAYGILPCTSDFHADFWLSLHLVSIAVPIFVLIYRIFNVLTETMNSVSNVSSFASGSLLRMSTSYRFTQIDQNFEFIQIYRQGHLEVTFSKHLLDFQFILSYCLSVQLLGQPPNSQSRSQKFRKLISS